MSVEVGDSWNWEVIEPNGAHVFPTYLRNPTVSCTFSGEEYYECCEVCEVTNYAIVFEKGLKLVQCD